MISTHALNAQIKRAGQNFRIRYYTETIGSVWDDERTIAQSGNDFYTSGIFLAIDTRDGSEDQNLFEQGRIRHDDSKIYISGTIATISGAQVFTISTSGLNRVYEPLYITAPEFGPDKVFKKVYVRELKTGSLA